MIGNTKVWLPTGERQAGAIAPPKPPIFTQFAKTLVFTTRPGAVCRQWGTLGALVVRRFEADTELRISGFYRGAEVKGDDRWLVIKSPGKSGNARIHIGDVREELPAVFLEGAA